MRYFILFDDAEADLLITSMAEEADRAQNMRKPLRRIADMYLEMQGEAFASRKGADGKPWPPLTPGTIASKARRGVSPEMLVFTGTLFNSVTHKRGTRYAATFSNNDKVVMGTSDPVAHLQGLGTKERFTKKGRSTGKIVPRRVAYAGQEFARRAWRVLMDYLAFGVISDGMTEVSLVDPGVGLGM